MQVTPPASCFRHRVIDENAVAGPHARHEQIAIATALGMLLAWWLGWSLGTGFVFGYIGFGSLLFNLLPHRIFGVVTNPAPTRSGSDRSPLATAVTTFAIPRT